MGIVRYHRFIWASIMFLALHLTLFLEANMVLAQNTTEQPKYIDFSAETQREKLYFLPSTYADVYRRYLESDNSFRADPKQLTSGQTRISSLTIITLSLNALLSQGYQFDSVTTVSSRRVPRLPDDWVVVREFGAHKPVIPVEGSFEKAGAPAKIRFYETVEGKVKIYLDGSSVGDGKQYVVGLRLLPPPGVGLPSMRILYWHGRNTEGPLVLSCSRAFDGVLSNVQGTGNASLLTDKINPGDTNETANAVRFKLDLNPERVRLGSSRIALLGEQVISTQPRDVQSQLQLFLAYETTTPANRRYEGYFVQGGLLMNQIASNQMLYGEWAKRWGLEEYQSPTPVLDIVNGRPLVELGGFGAWVICRDGRVRNSLHPHDPLFGFMARFQFGYAFNKSVGIYVESILRYMPFDRLRGGYDLKAFEPWVQVHVPFKVTDNTFSIGYQFGLSQSTADFNSGNFVFNARKKF